MAVFSWSWTPQCYVNNLHCMSSMCQRFNVSSLWHVLGFGSGLPIPLKVVRPAKYRNIGIFGAFGFCVEGYALAFFSSELQVRCWLGFHLYAKALFFCSLHETRVDVLFSRYWINRIPSANVAFYVELPPLYLLRRFLFILCLLWNLGFQSLEHNNKSECFLLSLIWYLTTW